jgi:transcriptional regulator with XRE-family HTH domain
VQKYERGTNRVAGGRLQQLATALNTTVSELIADNGAESGETLSGDARRLGYAFDQLPSEARRSILGLVEALATAQASSRKKRAS